MRILLLSAYDAESHKHWRELLVRSLPEYEWTVLALPGRFFSWRVRGNSLSWAFGQQDVLSQNFDLILATSMTDLSALRGMAPALANTPAIAYFHENQFAYPLSGREFNQVEPQVLNLYTALSADYILYNSEFNRRTMLEGVCQLLDKLPDQVPSGLPQRLQERSEVLPVPLAKDCFQQAVADITWDMIPMAERPLRIAWAARWEFDKGPQQLMAILTELESSGIDYRLALLGQRFRGSPKTFDNIAEQFSHRLDQFGYASSRQAYLAWLGRADIFLSTATHEFQGLSVLEAAAQQTYPLTPCRQAYPEIFGEQACYPDKHTDHGAEAKGAVARIIAVREEMLRGGALPVDVSKFSVKQLIPRYKEVFEQVAAAGRMST